METLSANHRPLPELDLRVESIDDVMNLMAAANDLKGVTETVARAFGAWVIVRHRRAPDGSASHTKARFRRMAAQLLAEDASLRAGEQPNYPERLLSAGGAESNFQFRTSMAA